MVFLKFSVVPCINSVGSSDLELAQFYSILIMLGFHNNENFSPKDRNT
jgi:hypothetical protein